MDNKIENHKEEIIKSLRKQLVSSEIRFQNILNHNSIPILIVNLDGIIRFANPSAEFLFHKPKEKLINQPFGFPVLLDETAEITIVSRNFPNTFAEMTVLETVWEDEKVFFISLRDITEHRNFEEKLRSSEEKYRSLIELSPFGIFIHSDGKCLFANPSGVRLLGGINQEDIVGQPVMRFVHPNYRSLASERIKALTTRTQTLPPVEEEFLKLDGTVIAVEIFASSFYYNGRIVVQLVVIDISERKKTEESIRTLNFNLESRVRERTKQLETINSELEAFSFSVSHDLKAPLRSIENFTNILLEDGKSKLDANQVEYLEKIKNSTLNMNSLITDLLDLAQINQIELNFQTFDLTSLCQGILKETELNHSNKNLEIILQPNMSIFADYSLLKIAMTNLIDNACKFTKHRQYATIKIGTFFKDERLIVFIQDNGAGFNIKNAEKLFLPFQRFHTNTDFEGTGIGLAIVSRIIGRHNGQIWAESEEGKGATFYFTVA